MLVPLPKKREKRQVTDMVMMLMMLMTIKRCCDSADVNTYVHFG